MLLRWGRRGVFVAALAVTHITPAPSTSTYVNKVAYRSSVAIESRHVTPANTTATYINRVEYRPTLKPKHITPSADASSYIQRIAVIPGVTIEYRHITPVNTPVVDVDTGGGGSRLSLLLREDQEIIDIITAIGPLLVG